MRREREPMSSNTFSASDGLSSSLAEFSRQARLDAIDRTFSTITFDPRGTILEVNDNFLALTGYGLSLIHI